MSKQPRTYGVYQALRKAIGRSGISPEGTTASLLLESFLERDGRILASQVVARGLCEEGKFRDWRQQLIVKEWLIWMEIQDDKGKYYPGKNLICYINKEKMASKEIATKDEVLSKNVAATKKELEVVREKLAKTDMELDTVKEKLANADERFAINDERLASAENSIALIYDKLELGEPDPPFYLKLQRKVGLKDDKNLKH